MRIRPLRLFLLVAAVAASMLAWGASASVAAPPLPSGGGAAPGLRQYEETLPDPKGDKPVQNIKPRSESDLPDATAASLQSQGRPGAAVAAIAAATKPQAHGHGHVASEAAVTRVLSGDGGLGPLFIILLALIAVAMLAVAVRRWRTRAARARAE